jgi:UDP-N-acetylmuramoylalanine--D-glutamate ligase
MDGVYYVNDSKGTNVDATIKAISAMKTQAILLLGGKNKGYNYAPLFKFMGSSKVKHAVLYGENRYELLESARAVGFEGCTVCDCFDFAVRIAILKAEKGETVLLSPASASFDEFAGYEERGDRFVEIIRRYAKRACALEEDGANEESE